MKNLPIDRFIAQEAVNGRTDFSNLYPYHHQSSQTRAQRRGNERVSINDLGMVSVQRRLKSAKRKIGFKQLIFTNFLYYFFLFKL